MSQEIRIEFTRFSAFYSPLIATIAGGFLKKEGLDARAFGVGAGRVGDREPRSTARRTSPSRRRAQGLTALEQGKTPPALHFAQINEKDGFFLAGRSPTRAFSWDKLKGQA